jgi:hypothetical protein
MTFIVGETQFDSTEVKAQRASARHRKLQKKYVSTEVKAERTSARQRNMEKKYVRYLLSYTAEPETQHTVSQTRGRRRARPHRSARALTRTFLSKGEVETGTDVPCVLVDHDEKFTPWARKPSVSPSLSCKRIGAFVPSTESQSREIGSPAESLAESVEPVDLGKSTSMEEQCFRENHPVDAGSPAESVPERLDAQVDAAVVMKDCQMESDYSLLCALCSENGIQPQLCSTDEGIGETATNIMLIMRSWLDTPKIQEKSFSALEHFATNRGWKAIVANDGVAAILNAIRRHTSVETLQERGCKLLGHIVAFNGDCRSAVASLGGVEIVLSAMRAHRHSLAVQSTGCRVLKELAACGDAVQEAILSASGIEAVMDSMEVHAATSDVQIAACGVFRNMSAGRKHLQDKIVTLGGVAKVLKAMRQHGRCEAVQWAGIWSLFCLALQNQSAQKDIAGEGGICQVLQAMSTHLKVLRVQEAGCWALKELAPMIESDVVRSECVQMVSVVLSVHNAAELCKVGRLALRKFLMLTRFAPGVGSMPKACRFAMLGEQSMLKRRRFPTSNDLPTILE